MNLKDKSKMSDHATMGVGKTIVSQFEPGCNVKIELFGPDGKLKDVRQVHNAVTDQGAAALMDQILASPTLNKLTHMAIGDGSPASTLLGNELGRVAFTTKTRSAKVVTFVGDFGASVGTGSITEAGTFDNGTADTVNMWMSASFGVITKEAADSLKITWTLTGVN